jgi:26 proteasome complex subunit DSS1
MSGATQASKDANKAAGDSTKPGEQVQDKKPATQLEEDDEFEDFPVEGT